MALRSFRGTQRHPRRHLWREVQSQSSASPGAGSPGWVPRFHGDDRTDPIWISHQAVARLLRVWRAGGRGHTRRVTVLGSTGWTEVTPHAPSSLTRKASSSIRAMAVINTTISDSISKRVGKSSIWIINGLSAPLPGGSSSRLLTLSASSRHWAWRTWSCSMPSSGTCNAYSARTGPTSTRIRT